MREARRRREAARAARAAPCSLLLRFRIPPRRRSGAARASRRRPRRPWTRQRGHPIPWAPGRGRAKRKSSFQKGLRESEEKRGFFIVFSFRFFVCFFYTGVPRPQSATDPSLPPLARSSPEASNVRAAIGAT